ncbi:tRNA (N6-isopentenyl adenosine(37)-C2)-methylthiotransferase MiaB [Dehalobacterium formicoaceticum]|uniref:tRNA-2-methylthio-N(6)-dimethylallyladenosine synthase n=1 Tax=Dehalobacterium formicoaceticum TaxID=51515 RepID=A0ABT1Y8F2_9FIRM|nr:tRNA (N6-isopentenyl adenosine(37)-C2)-methylthiotransferase MiaB [Dehalobacterium formicoaceticum]MCR6545936.1 tRNA (N6-isopentenyl adenosine(37)-C2)-methylthiotransferase MiaB [Dehalobacterium formicoaceticum]
MRPKYHVTTFGCQMNEHDSEIMGGMLESLGYEAEDDLNQSDIIIVNTCCVRESAENKIRGYIGNLKRLKQINPRLIIGIGGCMVQQPGAGEKLLKKAGHVDIVFGTHNIHRLPQLITEVRHGGHVLEIDNEEQDIQDDLPVKRQGHIKAQISIMQGCNNFCTYCIVPYVRGRERSRHPENIKKEFIALGNEGFKEVMLLGQNVNSYGLDFSTSYDFADLLKELDATKKIKRIRYMTSHPRDFNQKLIDTIAGCSSVCEHFHLPIQSGSNHILQLMNRGYTRETYLSLVRAIKDQFPDCSITTDLIIGFPGETDEDFQDTLALLHEAEFDVAYTFLYSTRSGTPAAKMPGQIPQEIKRERLQQLMDVQNSISLRINQSLVGKIEEVLVEGKSKTSDRTLTGRTRTNKIVNFPGEINLAGELIRIKITAAKTWHLEGEKIES